MSETFVESPTERADSLLQLLAAILLGLAATLTAVSAYESDLQNGAALNGYSNSTRSLNDSNAFYEQGNQVTAMDQQLFLAYELARHDGDDEKAAVVFSMMRPDLKKATRWWDKGGHRQPPLDPQTKGNPYDVPDWYDANDLEVKAAKLYKEAVKADNKGGKFELSTVLFALTLFFGGISTVFRRRSVSHALLLIGGVTLLLGSAQLIRAFTA
jgi:hypothetical protein